MFELNCRLTEGKQILSVNPVESSPLTACLNIPNSSQVILGTLQNEVALYQIDCCRLECVAQVHDDNITSLGMTFLFSLHIYFVTFLYLRLLLIPMN